MEARKPFRLAPTSHEMPEPTKAEPKPPPKPRTSRLVQEVVDHYRKYHSRFAPRLRSTSEAYVKIVARFEEGFTVDDLCAAIDGCHKSPFHLGENDRGKRYLSLEYICRHADKVTEFIELCDAPEYYLKPAREKERRDERAHFDRNKRIAEAIAMEERQLGEPNENTSD